MKRWIMLVMLLGMMGLAASGINGFSRAGEKQEAAALGVFAQETKGDWPGLFCYLEKQNVLFTEFMPTANLMNFHAQGQYVYVQASEYLMKFDRYGTLLTSRIFAWELSSKFSWEGVTDLTSDPYGNIFIVGFTSVPLLGRPLPWTAVGYVAKYSPDLRLLWCNYADISPNPWPSLKFQANHVATDSAGNSYVFGIEKNNPKESSFLVKYDPYGKKLWQRENFGGAGNANGYSIALVVDNIQCPHVLLSRGKAQQNQYYYYLHRLSPVDGRSYSWRTVPTREGAVIKDMAIDSNRNLVICGGWVYHTPSGERKICFANIWKYDANYNNVWLRIGWTLEAPQNWVDGSGFVISPFGWHSFDGCGLAVDTNNNFYMYVYGLFIGDGGALKPSSWLVKFNASGGFTRAANLYADDKTILTGISINQDNRIFVTGITYSSVLYGMVNPRGAKYCTFQMKVDRDF